MYARMIVEPSLSAHRARISTESGISKRNQKIRQPVKNQNQNQNPPPLHLRRGALQGAVGRRTKHSARAHAHTQSVVMNVGSATLDRPLWPSAFIARFNQRRTTDDTTDRSPRCVRGRLVDRPRASKTEARRTGNMIRPERRLIL